MSGSENPGGSQGEFDFGGRNFDYEVVEHPERVEIYYESLAEDFGGRQGLLTALSNLYNGDKPVIFRARGGGGGTPTPPGQE